MRIVAMNGETRREGGRRLTLQIIGKWCMVLNNGLHERHCCCCWVVTRLWYQSPHLPALMRTRDSSFPGRLRKRRFETQLNEQYLEVDVGRGLWRLRQRSDGT